MNKFAFTLLLGIVSIFGESAFSEEAHRFRGAGGTGVSEDQQFPSEWSDQVNISWKTRVNGYGWSSPLVTDGKVFVTAAVYPDQPRPKGHSDGVRSMGSFRSAANNLPEMSFEIHCLDLETGESIWNHTVVTAVPGFGIHPSNTFATESPATDGERIYAYFAAVGVVACVDLNGTLVWLEEIGVFPHGNGFGSGSGLALSDGRLFIQCDNDENSFVQALSTKDGSTLWKKSRAGRTSWSTPLVWRTSTGAVLVLCGSGDVIGYDPEDGSQLWELSNFGGSFSSSPAVDEDRIYMGNSGPRSAGPLVAIDANASGAVALTRGQAEDWVRWSKSGAGPGLSSPVSHEGLLYIIKSPFLNCYDSRTGEVVYEERLPSAARTAASLWIAGDNLFILNETGTTFVVPTGRQFSVTSENRIDDLFWSTPAVAGESLVLRGADWIYCVRYPEQQASVEPPTNL